MCNSARPVDVQLRREAQATWRRSPPTTAATALWKYHLKPECVELTQRRADAVKEHLASLPRVERQKLYAKGYGATRPLPGVVVGEGDRPNMRVTFEAANMHTVGPIMRQPLKYEPGLSQPRVSLAVEG